MIARIAIPGRPAFQLRKGEEGISAFAMEAVDPPLTELEILSVFRADSIVIYRIESQIEEHGLSLAMVPGSDTLPERLREAHCEIRAGSDQDRSAFKKHCKHWRDDMQAELLAAPDALETVEDAIRSFPVNREVSHCGIVFTTSPFAVYGTCPTCQKRIKLRSFSGAPEIEDVFDAVFEWMHQPVAEEYVRMRLAEIAADGD